MPEVPKIVYDRLRAGTGQEGHPNADLLTAFAEKTLSAAERESVLAHLALCRDCRDVVALGLPPLEAVGESAGAAEAVAAPGGAARVIRQKPRWLTWQGLRWAGVAVGVVVVGSVLVLHPWKQTPSPEERAARHAENTVAGNAVPAPSVPAPSTVQAPAATATSSVVPAQPVLSADKIAPQALAKAENKPTAVAADELRLKDTGPAPTRAQALDEKNTLLAGNERRDEFANKKKLEAGLPATAATQQPAAPAVIAGVGEAAPVKESPAVRSEVSAGGPVGGVMGKRQVAAATAPKPLSAPGGNAGGAPSAQGSAARGTVSADGALARAVEKQQVPAAPPASLAYATPASSQIGVSIERGRSSLFGQVELVGTITDPSGAVVAGARVEASGAATGETRTATTDANGRFFLSSLPADHYRVQLSAAGFKTAARDVTLRPQDVATLLARLSVGQTAEQVEVSAATPVIQTEAADQKTEMARADAAPIVKSKSAAQTEVSSANAAVPTTTAEVGSQITTNYAQDLTVTGRNVTQLAMLSVPAQWKISSHKLDRSLDGGATWSTVLNADHPLFCHAEFGSDVWVGGKSGALYHSSDGGTSWKQVYPVSQNHTIKDNIVRIEIRSATEVALSTRSGETWTTVDAGKTWLKK